MNIWVEFYKYSDDRKNTQMKESQNGSPDPNIISKRFFDKFSSDQGFSQNVWKRTEIWCQ